MTAAPFLPADRSLASLSEAAEGCRGCPLYARGSQTVFGQGSAHARIVLVGEQPGDVEDRDGRPFVGPAGRLLDRCLDEAGIDRRETYVTNAVKHFKWEARGKRRIHSKPSAREVRACYPWLAAELDAIEPEAIVALGATAASILLGSTFRLTQHRGEFIASARAPLVLATIHPSAILRAPDDETRHREQRAFVADLQLVARSLAARHAA